MAAVARKQTEPTACEDSDSIECMSKKRSIIKVPSSNPLDKYKYALGEIKETPPVSRKQSPVKVSVPEPVPVEAPAQVEVA